MRQKIQLFASLCLLAEQQNLPVICIFFNCFPHEEEEVREIFTELGLKSNDIFVEDENPALTCFVEVRRKYNSVYLTSSSAIVTTKNESVCKNLSKSLFGIDHPIVQEGEYFKNAAWHGTRIGHLEILRLVNFSKDA